MPNRENIEKPITLLGNGRSGTSLLMGMFNNHPEIFTVGESANLIHSVWHSLSCSLPSCNLTRGSRKQDNLDRIYSETIQDFFVKNFYSEEKHWFHKPIGVPTASHLIQGQDAYSQWYWDVLKKTFPQSRTIAIIRNPSDVLISSYKHWQRPIPQIAKSMVKMAKTLMAGKSDILHIVQYEELVKNPIQETKEIFDTIDIGFHPSTLKAFEKMHAPNHGIAHQDSSLMQNRKQSQFSHEKDYQNFMQVINDPEFNDVHDELLDCFQIEYVQAV